MLVQCGAEHELPSRARALRGEVQVMEIEMQILLLSGEKAPINQEWQEHKDTIRMHLHNQGMFHVSENQGTASAPEINQIHFFLISEAVSEIPCLKSNRKQKGDLS